MATDENDRLTSMFAMTNANTTMIRETMRHLVEEGLLEGSKAAKLCLDAAEQNFPHASSSGESYDLGREYLVKLAQAFLSFPGIPGSDRARGPLRKDL